MKKLLKVGLLLLAAALPANAQVADTVVVEVYGEPSALSITGPARAYVGDTITFTYSVVDSLGQPSVGVVSFGLDDPSRAAILSETDSTLVVQLLRPGRLTIIANVRRLELLAVGGVYGEGSGERLGRFHWASAGPFILQCEWTPENGDPCGRGAEVHLCAVGYTSDGVAFSSSDACAAAIGGTGVQQAVIVLPLEAFKGWEMPVIAKVA